MNTNKKAKIVHIIPALTNGGAEMMLYKLIKYGDSTQYQHEVITMRNVGIMREKIESLGVTVRTLNMKRGMPSIKGLKKAIEYCENVDIIQTWMYHANLMGLLINRKIKKKLIWGIRQSHLIKGKNKWHTILADNICAKWSNSKYLNKIISCSDVAAKNHCAKGYSKEKMTVIYNGFETDNYYKKENINRKTYGIPEESTVIVTAGRWNYIKNYDNLLYAAAILKKKTHNLCFVLCGQKMNEENEDLMQLVKQYEVSGEVKLLGRRDDLVDIFSIADIYVSSSLVEGFSNVIGEAMLCELPCVVTDVGDSALIVGETGKVVKPKQPEELAREMDVLINEKGEMLKQCGKQARERVKQLFEISNIVHQFEVEYADLMGI